MTIRGTLLSLCLLISSLCADEPETVAFKTLDISKTQVSTWDRTGEHVKGYYHFEYGDGGGTIILMSYFPGIDEEGAGLKDLTSKDLRYNGVIFTPVSILSKSEVIVLDELRLDGDKLVDPSDEVILTFAKMTLGDELIGDDRLVGKVVKGIILNDQFFEEAP